MLLKSLELQGFKSFPDKTSLQFDKGITAVVGPNGSGKSNISDAMRWVLGEQSTKTLRGAKMEDVIFGGTQARKAQGFAQVTLVLDNRDRQVDFDKDEISVTRRYYRSGESEYILDGATVRLRDIHELFMDTGLGRDGYSIISQGKIADIISSKSDERREIFEEAAGISKYRYRRRDAQRKLQQAEDNMVRLLDIRNELEDRVEPLRIQSEKAQKFLDLSAQKRDLEIGLWLHTINQSKEILREQEHKLTLAQSQYETVEDALRELEEEMELLVKQAAEKTVLVDDTRREASGLEEQAMQKETEIKVLETSMQHNEETIARIQKEIEQNSDSQESIDAQITEKQTGIETLRAKIEEKRAELEDASRKMQDLMNENAGFAQQIASASQQVTDLSLRIADARVAKSTAQSSIDEIRARAVAVDEILSAREDALRHIGQEKSESGAQLNALKDTVASLQNALEGYEIRLKTRRAKAETRTAEFQKAQADSQALSQKKHVLEELEKNMEGYSGAVKAVMRENKRQTLRGIHGALSQLIQVPGEYAVAIETALGAALQNIVTQTEQDAKQAIQFLKQKNLGRATFLPLSAIRARTLHEAGLEDCYGYINTASSLVNCDSQYKQLIENLLGRVVVVKDLDSAIGIAKKYRYGFKIVTLDGQVMNAGGSMTGGSRTRNSGILSRQNEIETLTKKLEKTTLQVNTLRDACEQSQRDLAASKAEVEGAKANLITAQEDSIRQQGELNLLLEQYQAAETQLNDLRQEKTTANARIDALMQTTQESQKEIDALEGKLALAQKEIEAVSTDKDTLAERRDALNETATQINLEIVTAQRDISAANESIQALMLQKLSQAERVHAIETEIAEIRQKNKDHAEQIASLEAERDGLREKASGSKQAIETIIAERTALEQRSSELRLEERAKTQDRERLSGELARLEERKEAMMREYDETINKLYDEYELTRMQAEEMNIDIGDPKEAGRTLSGIRSKIKSLGNVNVSAIEEYREVSERYLFLKEQLEDVEKSQRELGKLIKELTNQMSAQFSEQFYKINETFKTTMQEFFSGGSAELILENPDDILECGIEIKVQPPGKNVQNIALLSGGEKSLAAVALLFSILKVTPAPFCIYDEVEAALDDVNVQQYARYMRKMSKRIQFIAITHRRGTMEEADVLYGVTMQEKGVSKLLALKTAEMAKKMGI